MSLQINLGDRWMPFRRLDCLVKESLTNANNDSLENLKSHLDNNKPEFVSFLTNPPKNAARRQEVEKAPKDGVFFTENGNKFKTVISQSLVTEALLFSDIFNLDELTSLELLITAENQMSRYPNMSRGTIAVLYYYHGRQAIASALNSLMQVRSGRSWTPELPRETLETINQFTDSLKKENIVIKCLNILQQFDIVKEFEMLEQNRALGTHTYRKRVLEIMKETRRIVANIVFDYAAQTFLSRQEIFALLETLGKVSNFEGSHLDYVTTTLLLSLFYTFDVNIFQELDENDRATFVRMRNITAMKPDFLAEFFKKLTTTAFNVPNVKPLIEFFIGVNLKTVNLYPVNDFVYDIDEDELIDRIINEGVFEMFTSLLADNHNLYKEEFFVRQIHILLSDFIVNMAGKIKELRDQTDESCRVLNAFNAESIKPFSSPSLEFGKFLVLLGTFYEKESFGLSNQFWVTFDGAKSVNNRQHMLYKFVRSLHESTFPQVLLVSVIDFFAALSKNSPFNVFNLLKNASFHGSVQFSIGSFSEIVNQYLFSVRGVDNSDRVSASVGDWLPNGGRFQNNRVIVESSLVCSIVRLINVIVKNDRSCCMSMAECQYPFIGNMVAILKCAVPRELKADILKCFASFAKQISVSTLIWKEIDSILPKYSQQHLGNQKLYQNGIAIEIEEIEVKNEEYPITFAFLELMDVLFSHYETTISPYQQGLSESCFNFIMDSILLKSAFRVFQNEDEKRQIISLCYKILLNALKKFDGNPDNFTQRIFNVFSQVLQENTLFKHIIWTLEEVIVSYEAYITSPTLTDRDSVFEGIENCALTIVELLTHISDKQGIFFEMIKNIQGLSISSYVSLEGLFNNINQKTNRQDRLTILFRLMSVSNSLSIQTLQLFNSMVQNNFEVSFNCLTQLHNTESSFLRSDLIINMFVECLESDVKELRQESLNFVDLFLGKAGSNMQYTFGHKLIGIESKLFNLANVNFFGQNYTCLHSILTFFDKNCQEYIPERKRGMQILFKLCSSIHTYEVVLRFLRTSYDFTTNYLKFFTEYHETAPLEDVENLIEEFSYFFEILAIDLKVTSEQKLKSYVSSFTEFLFDKESPRPRLFLILFEFVFFHKNPELPQLAYFDSSMLLKTISTCADEKNHIDLPMLHQKLMDDINSYGPGLGCSTSIVREQINSILSYCTAMNRSMELYDQKTRYVVTWCELVQVLVLNDLLDTFNDELRSRFLMEICFVLMEKIQNEACCFDTSMYNAISSTLLIISSSIKHFKSPNVSNLLVFAETVISILDKNSDIWQQKQKRARVNLYGTLLNLFKYLPEVFIKEFKFNFSLLDRITKDVLYGHEVSKMLSICVLNQTQTSSWLNELVLNGSMKQLLLSVLADEQQIRASKYEHIKTFYVFQAKMMMLLNICSSSSMELNPIDIVLMVEQLQNFDIYPYLVCENVVCFKMFINILRLMIALTTNYGHQVNEQLGAFVSTRPMLSDIFRIAPSIKISENGKELLLLISKLISIMILHVNENLQNGLVGLLSQFCDEASLKTEHGSQIVFAILQACVKIDCSPTSKPKLFRLTLQNADSRVYAKHPLGVLVSIINICQQRKNEIKKAPELVESCLLLIYYHLNEFFNSSQNPLVATALNHGDDLVTFKKDAESVFNEVFFTKIQTNFEKNIFMETLSKRIRRFFEAKNSM